MIERIILDIKHGDDYTDYLFQTAALKNKRVIPMLNPSPEELEAVKDENTIIYHCHSTYCDPGIKSPIDFDDTHRAITVSTHYYIRLGGTVDGHKADDIRQRIEKHILDELESDENLRETFKQAFTILWEHREEICTNPSFFYAKCGLHNKFVHSIPLGAMLKSIDDNMELFTNPETGRILVDFEFCDTYNWYLEWWDPVSRTNFTEVIKWEDGFNEFKEKDLLACTIETACKKYCKGKWAGPFTVFDVLDRLSIIK